MKLVRLIKSFYVAHIFLISLLVIVTFILVIINLFINPKLTILSGEFLFSFDYIGHFKNLLINYLFNGQEFIHLSQCNNCPNFYNISAWYMLWIFGLLSIGQLIGLHPFLYYIFITTVVQLVFLYIFAKLLLGRFSSLPFVFAAIFFITAPHKIYLMPSATLDGVIYGLLLGVVTLWLYILINLKFFNFKKLFYLSLAEGIILSCFLNIAIAHFPLAVYALVLIGIPFYISALKYSAKKFVFSASLITLTSVIINIPIIYAQIISGDIHYLTNFNSLSLFDGLSAGFITAGVDRYSLILYGIIFFLLLFITKIKLRLKLALIAIYLSLAFLLTGGKVGQIYIYQYIFDYVPFMEHIRGLYRFISFEFIIIFIFSYLGLRTLLENKRLVIKASGILIGILLIILNTNYILKNQNFFQFAQLPQEYFDAYSYLKDKPGIMAYFPLYGPSGNETMSGNYKWSVGDIRNNSVYSNPFTSLFILPGMLVVDGYQLSTIQESELRALINYNDSDTSIKELSYLGVKYLVVDKNYLWNKYYPDANLSDINKSAVLEKKFGNILIYHIQDKSDECKPSYGDSVLGYCYSETDPKFIINKTVEDYLLDHLELDNSQYIIPRNKSVRIPDNIVSSQIRDKILKQKILIPFTVYQSDNNVEKIFVEKLTPGSYKLYLPILKLSAADRLFGDSILNIKLDDKLIGNISPYSAYHGVFWKTLELNVTHDSTLSIGSNGSGTVIFGNPLILDGTQVATLNDAVLNNHNLRILSTYGPQNSDLTVQINGNAINTNEKYFSTVEVDLLSDKFTNVQEFQKNFKKYEDTVGSGPTFTTINNNDNYLNYYINSNKKIKKLDLVVGSAFIDSDRLGKILILNHDGQIIYQTSIYKNGESLSRLNIPTRVLTSTSNSSYTIRLVVDKKGALLYRLVMEAEFLDE